MEKYGVWSNIKKWREIKNKTKQRIEIEKWVKRGRCKRCFDFMKKMVEEWKKARKGDISCKCEILNNLFKRNSNPWTKSGILWSVFTFLGR